MALGMALSLFDIRFRFRGSLLGPFGLTPSTAVMIGAIGFVYSRLFHQDVAGYLPFLGQPLEIGAWINELSCSAALVLLSFMLFVRARPRISYWV